AHFHYVLNGAVVFPIFGALYFWLPKITGNMLSERLGKVSFWIMFVGFNVAFFPMHILGFLGMPRRVYTYPSGLGWDALNMLITIFAFVFAFGVLLTLVNFIWSNIRPKPAGPNPWGADSLEWATSSPPPEYNFAAIPVVAGRHPLWDQHPLTTAVPGDDDVTPSLTTRGTMERETPFSEGISGDPEALMRIPHETYVPFVAALGILVLLCGLLVKAVLVGVLGVILGLVGILWWAWKTGE
ncbi:MAG: cbb3-type cytochrome c oxidase subunit I, partial [Actinobacteria bacterium]|nr:cbb3-type cytochrome c oxidase subunit I [Actinomycetota bacterium]